MIPALSCFPKCLPPVLRVVETKLSNHDYSNLVLLPRRLTWANHHTEVEVEVEVQKPQTKYHSFTSKRPSKKNPTLKKSQTCVKEDRFTSEQ